MESMENSNGNFQTIFGTLSYFKRLKFKYKEYSVYWNLEGCTISYQLGSSMLKIIQINFKLI